MSFKKKNYKIIKQAVSPELSEFLSNYLLCKKEVYITMSKSRFIPSGSKEIGTMNDGQVEGAFSIYGDPAFDVLLQKLLFVTSKELNLELIPTYSYTRSYSSGQKLEKHTDRKSCDISTTLNLGGDPWPIYFLINKKKIRVDLKPGDMVAYRGEKITHWRDVFEGRFCNQVFFHYNFKKGRLYDTRPHLGLPTNFVKIKDPAADI
tara:strand:+ start:1421 stop:2035 length:615 start_codon:yes stop_codon:yes gene_type:complete